jgi:hypothetical protein
MGDPHTAKVWEGVIKYFVLSLWVIAKVVAVPMW